MRISRYEVIDELGRGGMGVVYRALDTDIGRRVALKVITPELGRDSEFARRFEREMRIAATLEHPHVVPVYETGNDDEAMYIAMRLVDGSDLRRTITSAGRLDGARVTRIARQIASALDAAHARGLVHRDVKPGNVLLTGAGEEEYAYLTDFGLAREMDRDTGITTTGRWMGTVDYAAPEQVQGQGATARTDVYALGCVLYQALAGHLPFRGSVAAKAMAHVREPLPSVGGALPHASAIDAVLRRATAKDPEDRHPSAGDLARALGAAVDGAVPEQEERTVATGQALLLPTSRTRAHPARGAPLAPAAPLAPDATAATTHRSPPRRPRTPPVPAATGPRTPPSSGAEFTAAPRGGPRGPALAVAIVVLAALGVGIALLIHGSGSSDQAGSREAKAPATVARHAAKTPTSSAPADTTTTPPPTASPTTTTPPPGAAKQGPAAPPGGGPGGDQPAGGGLAYAGYTAHRTAYSAQLPSSGGWKVTDEYAVNSRIDRTVVTGPGGAQLWIEATPRDRPEFGRQGRSLLDYTTFPTAAGRVRAYTFTGYPGFCEKDACVDYQLDLGTSGYAVLAGPSEQARTAARHVVSSIQPGER